MELLKLPVFYKFAFFFNYYILIYQFGVINWANPNDPNNVLVAAFSTVNAAICVVLMTYAYHITRMCGINK